LRGILDARRSLKSLWGLEKLLVRVVRGFRVVSFWGFGIAFWRKFSIFFGVVFGLFFCGFLFFFEKKL